METSGWEFLPKTLQTPERSGKPRKEELREIVMMMNAIVTRLSHQSRRENNYAG
jgi:hypothetical protein